MTIRHKRNRFRGQGMVEFALVGPLFFLMLIGTIEMGRLMWVSHELSNGTREGARYATVRGELSGENISENDVRIEVLKRTVGMIDASLTVNVTWSGDPVRSPGSTVTVATTYVHQFLVGGFLGGLGDITMNRQSTMTVHY